MVDKPQLGFDQFAAYLSRARVAPEWIAAVVVGVELSCARVRRAAPGEGLPPSADIAQSCVLGIIRGQPTRPGRRQRVLICQGAVLVAPCAH